MNINLDKNGDINAAMACCPRCGETNGEILLLGNKNYKAHCNGCNTEIYGVTQRARKCSNCKESKLTNHTKIDPYDVIPTNLCDQCINELKILEDEIANGGIYWKCIDCNSHGIIKANSDIAKDVRKKLNIKKPHPCVLEITANECSNCEDAKNKQKD